MGQWGGGMGWGWLFLALLVIGIVVLAVVLVAVLAGGTGSRAARGPDQARPDRDRAREILAERYARGEVSTEEYQERLRILEDG